MKISILAFITLAFSVAGVISTTTKAESITSDLLLIKANITQTLKAQEKLQTYEEPNIPLKTRYPATMKVSSGGSGEGVGIFFTFKPQGNALDEAEISFFFPKGSATAADFEEFVTGANGLIENNSWKLDSQTTDTSEFPYSWIKKIIHFSTDKEQSGEILLGETNGQAVQVILLYPAEMSEVYWPSARIILENLEFKDELLPIGTKQDRSSAISYQCEGGKTILVLYQKESDSALVRLPSQENKPITLPHVPSGSGAKYSDGKTTFWEKGGTAFVEVNGKIILQECKANGD
jgi:membrane-bound inhibitor of C-type lysozyme